MKKLICSLLTLSLALFVLTASYAQEETDIDILRAADVNADGVIDIRDLVLVASSLGETPIKDQTPNPDVNGDGNINILDLVLVASHLGETVRPPVAFVSVDPAIDSEITVDDTITLTFDNPPEDVTVSEGTATVTDKIVTITGPFTPGDLALTITWADGTETLSYTIRPLAALVSTDPESGVEITTNDSITLTFDNPPEDVTVSTGVATTDGNTVTITGPFTPGDLALTITWADGTETLSYTIRQLVEYVSIEPTVESPLAVDGSIIVMFDNPPGDVTVSAGEATTDGNTVTITGPFTPGDLELTITWADGSLTFTYTVAEPDTEAPSITGGTLRDGDTDVDAGAINSSLSIEVEFSEAVRGNIALQTEAGDDVGWIGKVEGNKGILELVKGKELGHETTSVTYVIVAKVADAAGNEADINITFTTAITYDGTPIEVTDETFDSTVLASKVPIVVDFYKDG